MSKKHDVQPKTETVPKPPEDMRDNAEYARSHFGVPVWLSLLLYWTGSQYGTKCKAHNIAGEGKTPAEYPHTRAAVTRAAVICSQATGGKYEDPATVIASLGKHFPKAKSIDYTLFTEAK